AAADREDLRTGRFLQNTPTSKAHEMPPPGAKDRISESFAWLGMTVESERRHGLQAQVIPWNTRWSQVLLTPKVPNNIEEMRENPRPSQEPVLPILKAGSALYSGWSEGPYLPIEVFRAGRETLDGPDPFFR